MLDSLLLHIFPVSQDERNEKEKLIAELIQKDKEWNRREQSLGLQYKKEINDLKQKVFVLESRAKDVDDKKRQSKASNLKVSYKGACICCYSRQFCYDKLSSDCLSTACSCFVDGLLGNCYKVKRLLVT